MLGCISCKGKSKAGRRKDIRMEWRRKPSGHSRETPWWKNRTEKEYSKASTRKITK